ncbi:hypothetical protein K7432_015615 [Basidiobolus ranarum]|uniref:Uncharacterized protein n=1 Tax=Basidiobolus ranarum TaxID=34480 RepID=A0ABR2WG20_9FUNG
MAQEKSYTEEEEASIIEDFDSGIGSLTEIGSTTTLPSIKMTLDNDFSDKNSLLYWDIDITYPSDFYEDEKRLSIALSYLTDDDSHSHISSSLDLESCSGGVLFEKKPTKLGGLRDKLKGSIKHSLGFILHNEKWLLDGQYLIALGHHKIKAAKSKVYQSKEY